MPMEFTVEHQPNHTVITGFGRLNMGGAPQLRQIVSETVASGHNRVVVDMGQVEFMDSSGLGALVGSLKAARLAGGDLRIANITSQVRMVLELTGMNRVMTPYATTEEAFPDA